MAEVGLVASIFSIAAFGTSVATTLYEAADVMIHADQQIYILAKHVSQFTAVLKHMGDVLDKEKSNCSKEVLRDIKKIRHSCKRTFKEINSTLKPKGVRHFVSLRWLFKRTKAMELEARLNSQQSMVQCVIHTLTVSKLGQMDSRSKEDSGHLTDLKIEIKLLKTFIMENYNNLTELRHAEQLAEAEADYAPNPGGFSGYHPPYVNDGTFAPNPSGGSREPSKMRSPSLTSDGSLSEKDDLDSADEAAAAADTDDSGTKPAGGTSMAEPLMSRVAFPTRPSNYSISDPSRDRESSFLLQIVPYRPIPPKLMNPNRLISLDGRGPDRDAKTATQEATNSVRLLLDKWTTSGSAPVSDLLKEEAARDNREAEKYRTTNTPLNPFLPPSSPVGENNEDIHDYSGFHGYSHPQDDHTKPPPPWSNMLPYRMPPQPRYEYPPHGMSAPRQKAFWMRSHPVQIPTDNALGDEILGALRSTRGGIHYTKSNPFEQVHYVDQYPIYTCSFAPSHIVPPDQRNFVTTEVDIGLVRGEALALLGYMYEDTMTGKFSISGDLELREIEELVKLSYQALDKNSTKRSEAIVKERGWDEIIKGMNIVPRAYPDEPFVVPRYRPPMPESRYPKEHAFRGYARPQTDGEHDYSIAVPDRSAPYPPHQPLVHPHRDSFVRSRGFNIETTSAPPNEVEPQVEAVPQPQLPEVRFTLPRVQLTSGDGEKIKGDRASPTQLEVPVTSTDIDLQTARQRLEQYKKKKEAAEKANDTSTAADITFYAIPEIEARIQVLLELQRREQEKNDAPGSHNKDEKSLHQTEVETESEGSDDDGSDVQSLYD